LDKLSQNCSIDDFPKNGQILGADNLLGTGFEIDRQGSGEGWVWAI